MSTLRPLALAAAALVFVLGGCGDDHAHDESDGHGHESALAAVESETYKEGRGLIVAAATRASLGLATAPAEDRAVPRARRVTGQVIEAGPPALATATVTAAEAASFAGASSPGARLAKVAPHTAAPGGLVDLVFELVASPAIRPGDFVSLELVAPSAAPATAVPRTALLQTANGTFVYVVNGAHFLRTPVRPGAEAGDWVEITDGLYAGDVVVTSAVEQLWLAELRLTKGGGHSH
jgi:hypothetical protein